MWRSHFLRTPFVIYKILSHFYVKTYFLLFVLLKLIFQPLSFIFIYLHFACGISLFLFMGHYIYWPIKTWSIVCTKKKKKLDQLDILIWVFLRLGNAYLFITGFVNGLGANYGSVDVMVQNFCYITLLIEPWVYIKMVCRHFFLKNWNI